MTSAIHRARKTIDHANRGALARTLLAAALCGCLALAAVPALAQSTGATIRGQTVADATVVVLNPATGLRRSVQAGADGHYSVAGLPPGTYRIEVQSGGLREAAPVVALHEEPAGVAEHPGFENQDAGERGRGDLHVVLLHGD